jgi:hypothetical protein
LWFPVVAAVTIAAVSKPAKESISEALVRAWQDSDPAERDRVWGLLWASTYTMAVRFCASVGNASYAEDAAARGFLLALSELDPDHERKRDREDVVGKLTIGGIPFEWRGEEHFVAFVRNRVILRCRDALRAEWRWMNRLVDTGDGSGEGEGDLGWLSSTAATQDDLVRGELLKRLLQDLAAWREICHGRQALVDVVVATQDYVRDCLIEAGRQASERAGDGRVWQLLTVDELVERVDPQRVDIARPALHEFLRQRLSLEKNVVYLRMREIRKLITGVAS